MEEIQCHNAYHHDREAYQPPNVDNGPPLDIEDEEIVKEHDKDDGRDKGGCCELPAMHRHIRTGKRREEEQGHQVEEMEKRAYVEKAHHLPSADVLTQVGHYRQHRQLLHGES